MTRLHSIIVVSILILSALYIVPAAIRPGHSLPLGTGEVCLARFGATLCPGTAPLLNSTNSLPVHQLKVAVVVNSSAGITGFDIILLANSTVLKPASISLAGTVLKGSPVVLVDCLSGVLISGSLCSTHDTVDTIELAATSAAGQSPTLAPTTGLLFTAVYNVTNVSQLMPIGFQTGCSGTSVIGLCVTINGLSAPNPEIVQTAKFTDKPYFDVQGYSLASITPVGTVTDPRRTTDLSLGINVTTINDFNGRVTIAPSVPAGINVTASVSPAIAWVNNTNPTSVFFSSPSAVTLVVGAVAPPGTYSINFTGTSPGFPVNVLSLVLVIPMPDFSITSPAAPPNAIEFNVTTTSQATLTLTGIGNFTGNVNLSISTPTGLNATLANTQVTIPPKNSVVQTTIRVNSTITGGYVVNVTATAGPLIRTTQVAFIVQDFVMTAIYPTGSGNVLTMPQGANNTEYIGFGTVTGPPAILYNVNVTLGKPIVQSSISAPKPSLGLTVNCTPRIQNLTNNGQNEIGGQSRCVVVGLVPGNYTVTIPGSSGRNTNSVTFAVQVLGPDFTVVSAVSVLQIGVGNSTSVSVSLISKLGFSGDLSNIQAQFAAASTCPSPPAAGFHTGHYSAALTSGSTVIDQLGINTTSTTPTGICFLVVSATYAPTSLTRSTTMTIVVTATASPHNLEVYSVMTDTQSTSVGTDVKISITVVNLGTVADSSTVVALAGSVDVGEMNFTNLGPGQNITETIVWKTSTFAAGTYTIGGQVLPATGQTSSQNSIVRMPSTVTLSETNPSVVQSPYFEPAIIAVLVVLIGLIGFMFLQARRKVPAKQ